MHDFTFRDPLDIYAGLTGGGMMMDHSTMGQGQGMPMGEGGVPSMDHGAMGQGMTGMGHLNDVEFDAYLANDRTLDDPEVVAVESGGNVRLRIINGAASTNFWIDLGALEGELVAVDGSYCRGVGGRPQPPAADSLGHVPACGHQAGPPRAWRLSDRGAAGGRCGAGRHHSRYAGAVVSRVPARGEEIAPALTLDIERSSEAFVKFSPRAANRRLTLDLTGSMMGYVWGLNGRKYGSHQALTVRQDERVEIEMVNRTDMSHPMHLHGHTFQVVKIDGQRIAGPMRDTVLVP